MLEFFEELKNENQLVNGRYIPHYVEYDNVDINRSEILRYAGYPASALRKKNIGGSDAGYIELLSNKCARCGNKCSMSTENISEKDTTDNNIGTDATDCTDISTNIGGIKAKDKDDEFDTLEKLLDESIALSVGKLTYRISYVCVKLTFDKEGYPILPFEQKSDNLRTNLTGCKGAIIFAATIGAGIDMLIRRYERTAPAKGLIFQGMGAERVESLCDRFNEEVTRLAKENGFDTKPRFSPGYGDLPISVQPYVLKLVDAGKRLGITLNDSLLMSPSKSVTAIIGIK